MTLDTIFNTRDQHAYYTNHHQYTTDDDLYDTINSIYEEISFPPEALKKNPHTPHATAYDKLLSTLNSCTTYYRPDTNDIPTALAVGLTPFYYHNTLYYAGNGDSRSRMDAYTMLTTGSIPTDSTALTDPERFASTIGKHLATRAYNACKRTGAHEPDQPYDLESALSQFSGTEQYYPSSFGSLRLTDGAHYLRERANAYWLVDLIESYQPQLQERDFQLWGITVNDDQSATVYCKEDSDTPNLVEQHIEYTDFPLRHYELYVANNVLLLKNEY